MGKQGGCNDLTRPGNPGPDRGPTSEVAWRQCPAILTPTLRRSRSPAGVARSRECIRLRFVLSAHRSALTRSCLQGSASLPLRQATFSVRRSASEVSFAVPNEPPSGPRRHQPPGGRPSGQALEFKSRLRRGTGTRASASVGGFSRCPSGCDTSWRGIMVFSRAVLVGPYDRGGP
jgi:hypothetical protein